MAGAALRGGPNPIWGPPRVRARIGRASPWRSAHLFDTRMTHPESPAVRPESQKLFAPLAFLLLLGCGHTEPFGSTPGGTEQPFDPSPPVRLTLNQGPDRGAAWLPDGSGILYSAQQLGRDDHDVCLAL